MQKVSLRLCELPNREVTPNKGKWNIMLDVIFSLNTIWWTLMAMYVPACIGLVGIVLLQQGKGGGFGGALGGGSGPGADTVFGTKSSQTLPVKITYVGATLFMAIAIILSVLSGRLDTGAAPDLIEGADAGPSAQTSSNRTMSSFGMNTAIVDASRHGGSAAPINDAPAATEEPTETEETTEETPAEETSDASE